MTKVLAGIIIMLSSCKWVHLLLCIILDMVNEYQGPPEMDEDAHHCMGL